MLRIALDPCSAPLPPARVHTNRVEKKKKKTQKLNETQKSTRNDTARTPCFADRKFLLLYLLEQ